MNGLITALLAVVLLTQAFIDLELALDLGVWQLNAPVADLAALGLVALLPWMWGRRPPVPAPGPAAAYLAVVLVSALLIDAEAAHSSAAMGVKWGVRRPAFLFVAYALALPAALHQVSRERADTLLVAGIGVVGAVSVVTSVIRIASGWGSWWSDITMLTPNHKTLAVWAAPFVPWLWTRRGSREGKALLGLVLAAIALSSSKAAIITAGFGLAWVLHWRGRPLAQRWALTAVAIAVAGGLAIVAPSLLQSRTMSDALRSRHSLNKRNWTMFEARPVLGMGPGTSTTVEMTEFPHYRINGVEAHGVLQKTAGETGVLGAAAWLTFSGALLLSMRRRWLDTGGDTHGEAWAWVGVAGALHLNLVHSTEAFTMTHWVPLGIAWAQLHREDP